MFSKYAWLVPVKDKRETSIVNAFQKIISEGSEAESKGRRKPNEIWIDQDSKFYKNYFKDFIKTNNIEMYSIYNEGKFVVAERFIRTLKKSFFLNIWQLSQKCFILMS